MRRAVGAAQGESGLHTLTRTRKMFPTLALAPTLTLALLLEAGNPDVCIIHKCTTIRLLRN